MVANGLFYWDFLQPFTSKRGTTRHKQTTHIHLFHLLYMENEITAQPGFIRALQLCALFTFM